MRHASTLSQASQTPSADSYRVTLAATPHFAARRSGDFEHPRSSNSCIPPTSASVAMSTPAPAPNRSERAHCWEQRDQYFSCLDKNGIQQSGGPPGSEGSCKKERAGYEGACARSWVSDVANTLLRPTSFAAGTYADHDKIRLS